MAAILVKYDITCFRIRILFFIHMNFTMIQVNLLISVRTALLAIIGFMPTHGNGAIGSLDYASEERKILAKKYCCYELFYFWNSFVILCWLLFCYFCPILRSEEWTCQTCGKIKSLLKQRTKGASKSDAAEEAKKLASQISFKVKFVVRSLRPE